MININYNQLLKAISKVKINAVIINHKNENVFTYYRNKKQENTLHHINSCTKSVMSILYGIAIKQGLIESLNIPVYTYFKELFLNQSDLSKYQITLFNLLSMSDGLDFPEFGEWKFLSPMNYQEDIVKFVIERDMVHPVGTFMNYNSGCSHILAAILQKITLSTCEEYANKHLFTPLGIKEYRWYQDKKKINKGADGLNLKIDDMVKIGQLMLNNGVYNNQQIIKGDWIKEVTTPLFYTYKSIGYYGLHWWVNKIDQNLDFSYNNTYYFALGLGGQNIIILPSFNMVIAIVSEMYQDTLKPMKIILDQLFER